MLHCCAVCEISLCLYLDRCFVTSYTQLLKWYNSQTRRQKPKLQSFGCPWGRKKCIKVPLVPVKCPGSSFTIHALKLQVAERSAVLTVSSPKSPQAVIHKKATCGAVRLCFQSFVLFSSMYLHANEACRHEKGITVVLSEMISTHQNIFFVLGLSFSFEDKCLQPVQFDK